MISDEFRELWHAEADKWGAQTGRHHRMFANSATPAGWLSEPNAAEPITRVWIASAAGIETMEADGPSGHVSK